MADPRLRQIKIKTGVVKRLGKEREVNKKEIAQQEKRIQKYKDEGRDEYDIKKQVCPCVCVRAYICIYIHIYAPRARTSAYSFCIMNIYIYIHTYIYQLIP